MGKTGNECIAKGAKEGIPPHPQSVDAPKSLVPLMQAFHVESDEAAKALILESAKAISRVDETYHQKTKVLSDEDVQVITALMRSLAPRDGIETLYAAQVISTHILGMRKLDSVYEDDQKLGLSLLKFSNEAMQQLDRKRSGRAQNITVNYNYNGSGNAMSQTVLKGG